MSRRKKGSPLDSLSKREFPRLDEVKATTEQLHSDTVVQQEEDEDPSRSSNVTLPESMWFWIDDRYQEAHRGGWRNVRKSSIIRAIMKVVMTAEVDLSGVTSEDEIAERLRRGLGQ